MKSLFRLAIILLSLLYCTACGGKEQSGNDQTDTPEEVAEFAIAVSEITATSARVAITPKSKYIKYYFDVLRADYYRVYHEQYGFQRFINATINALSSKDNITTDEALVLLLSMGNATYDFNSLDPDTEYYVVVMGLDINGWITTEVYSKSFNTL